LEFLKRSEKPNGEKKKEEPTDKYVSGFLMVAKTTERCLAS
jgi:hypothetical protein